MTERGVRHFKEFHEILGVGKATVQLSRGKRALNGFTIHRRDNQCSRPTQFDVGIIHDEKILALLGLNEHLLPGYVNSPALVRGAEYETVGTSHRTFELQRREHFSRGLPCSCDVDLDAFRDSHYGS